MKLTDGSPEWLPMCEERLVGAALLSEAADVVAAAAVVTPEDFRDPLLARIWGVLPYLTECPCIVHAADALDRDRAFHEAGGVKLLVELTGSWGAFLYAGRASLEAHAALVRKQADIRRQVRQVVAEANEKVQAIRATGPTPLYDRPEYADLKDAV